MGESFGGDDAADPAVEEIVGVEADAEDGDEGAVSAGEDD